MTHHFPRHGLVRRGHDYRPGDLWLRQHRQPGTGGQHAGHWHQRGSFRRIPRLGARHDAGADYTRRTCADD